MIRLTADHFAAFFRELHGYEPFPWQKRLAVRVCGGEWPEALDLPTASGKTACIDIAVFAMAVHQAGPRRIFFVVDRRVVVDAAFDRMNKIAKKLHSGEGDVLAAVAGNLREMADSEDPLDVYQLRGGIYRDDSWIRSPLQPTVAASTVDQVGSRLLFRGYGVWDKTLPIHASLAANDALILLDEAHCSQAFAQTLRAVRKYRGDEWARQNVKAPFAFVEITATPGQDNDQTFALDDADYQNPKMRSRLFAPKPAQLKVSKVRTRDFQKLAENLAEEAIQMGSQPGLRRIAVMVNRVRTARLTFEVLQKRNYSVRLLIGRMRPVDRAELGDLERMLSDSPRTPDDKPFFVVATQCLEVGADLDFDAVVTECASIDALIQRFGRLDRIGSLWESGISAQGCVLIPSAMTDPKYKDPIYREALGNTWRWLQSAGEIVDFGISSQQGSATVRERLRQAGDTIAAMRREAPPSPTLLPAHLDALAQTSPRPELEPDIRLFLHGLDKGSPEVQVVWRADLDIQQTDQWAEIVALCPPVSAEAMSIPLRDFCAWLSGDGEGTESSDIEGADTEVEIARESGVRVPVLRWRGDQSDLIEKINELRPGDTLVLAKESGGWNDLGHIPETAKQDAAEHARFDLRRGWLLRLHPAVMADWPEAPAKQRLSELTADPTADPKAVRALLQDYSAGLSNEPQNWLTRMLTEIPNAIRLEAYPSKGEAHVGWVLIGSSIEADSGQDESSAGVPVLLEQHLEDVGEALSRMVSRLTLGPSIVRSLVRAAQFHDCGKADPRFQALLRGGDPIAAQFAPALLAKGRVARESPFLRMAQWRRSGLPNGFRHELISLLLVRNDPELAADDLALHLIASHHGRCRPFAPVVENTGPDFSYNGWRVTSTQRSAQAAHRLDSGVADRFWELTRNYGWWGLAYLESLLRLADWDASRQNTRREDK